MPVIVTREDYATWLGQEPANMDRLRAIMAPYPADEMKAWPIGTRVGSIGNGDSASRPGEAPKHMSANIFTDPAPNVTWT